MADPGRPALVIAAATMHPCAAEMRRRAKDGANVLVLVEMPFDEELTRQQLRGRFYERMEEVGIDVDT